MGAAYKKSYPVEAKVSDTKKDKQTIAAYQKKIEQALQDPKMQKKAALILEQLINNKGPK